MGVSLKPSDAIAGGAVIDDIDALIVSCRFRLWDYNGTIPNPVLGLAVTYRDDEGTDHEQVYSAGDPKHFVPSDDGSEAVQVGNMPAMNDSTNAMAWMVSMVNAGFPENKITDKVTVFEGTRVHVKQAPQPKRKGLKNQPAGETSNKMVVLVSKILAFPWDAPAPAAAGPKKPAPVKAGAPALAGAPVQNTAAPAAVQTPAGNGEATDLTSEGVQLMLGILAAKGGSIAKGSIAQEAFKAAASHPMRNALVQLVYKDDFLAAGPWKFDGTTVSFG